MQKPLTKERSLQSVPSVTVHGRFSSHSLRVFLAHLQVPILTHRTGATRGAKVPRAPQSTIPLGCRSDGPNEERREGNTAVNGNHVAEPIRGINSELEAHLSYVIPDVKSSQILGHEFDGDTQVVKLGRPPIKESQVNRLSLWIGECRQWDVNPPNILRGVDVCESRQLSRLDSQSCESLRLIHPPTPSLCGYLSAFQLRR